MRTRVTTGLLGVALATSGVAATAPGAIAAPAAAKTYTMAQVKKHNTGRSCWSVINGSVYNLTPWIAKHPGGAQKIRSICGRDGSAAFGHEHGQDARAKKQLATMRIGRLKK